MVNSFRFENGVKGDVRQLPLVTLLPHDCFARGFRIHVPHLLPEKVVMQDLCGKKIGSARKR